MILFIQNKDLVTLNWWIYQEDNDYIANIG